MSRGDNGDRKVLLPAEGSEVENLLARFSHCLPLTFRALQPSPNGV